MPAAYVCLSPFKSLFCDPYKCAINLPSIVFCTKKMRNGSKNPRKIPTKYTGESYSTFAVYQDIRRLQNKLQGTHNLAENTVCLCPNLNRLSLNHWKIQIRCFLMLNIAERRR